VTGNEVIDTLGANWPAGGLALGTKAVSITTAGGASTPSVISFTAANTGSGSNVTITAAFGALVYDSTITAGTVAKQGLCFNYFGGTQGVTAGTFTVVWDPSGVFKLSNT
jgi:hypothetical protein